MNLMRLIKKHQYKSIYEFLSWLKNAGLKYYLIHRYQEIDGWLSPNEAIALYDLARSINSESPIVVELGSWQGKSTFVLSKGLNEKHLSKIFCIDPFNADGDLPSKIQYKNKKNSFKLTLKNKFRLNCDIYGMNRFVQILEGYSYEYSKSWSSPIDLLFIDANHSQKAVYKDYIEWSNFVVKGGYIAFHDVLFDVKNKKWSSPGEVVNSYLVKDKRFALHKYVDSLIIARRI